MTRFGVAPHGFVLPPLSTGGGFSMFHRTFGSCHRQAKDPDARLRADVADILGLGSNDAALAIVEPMVGDTDPQVARAAERAVARLRGSRPTS